MKNLKKLIAVVLTFALVFSAMAVGFAATTPFTDVKDDAPYASAVARLAALNITNGVGDGKFGVDEPVTRAMMVTFVNRMLGYEGLADMAKGEPSAFKDVPQTYWAVGQINLAYKMGLAKGVGDGKFDPNGKLTYAQALTFVLRALNYKNLEWPYGYIAQAQKLGLTSGISVAYNDVITRGNLALVLDRALDQKVVTYDVNGNVVTKDQPTLLESGLTYLGYAQVTGVVTNVTATQATVGSAIVNVGSVDFKSLVGQNATVYVKNGTALIAVPTGNTIIKTTQITNDTVAGTIYYVASDNTVKTIPVANNNVVIYNGQTLSTGLSDSTTLGYVKGSSATLIDNNNDGKVEYIIATKYDAPEKIRFIDATNKVVYANGTYNLGAANVTYTITKNGKAATFADLAVGDVIQVAVSPDGTIYQILASSNTVTGKVVEIKPITNTIKLDNGVEYGFASGAKVSASTNYFTAGNTYTLYLDSNGKIYDAKLVTATYAANYAYVVKKGKSTDAFNNTTYKFQIVKPDGTTAVYDLVNNVTAFNGTVQSDVYNGIYLKVSEQTPITYDVNANGQFTNVSLVTLPVSGNASVDQTNKTLTIGTTTYYVTDSTVIYQVYNGTVKPIKFADIGTGNKAVQLSTTGSFNQVQYLEVDDAIAPITTGTVGVYEGYAYVADGYKLYVNVNGTDTAYTVLSSVAPTFTYGDIISFSVDSQGNAYDVKTASTVNGEVYAISNTFINIGGTVKPLDPAVKIFKLVKDTSGNVTGVTTASFGEIVPQQTGTDADGKTIVYVHGSNVNAYVDATSGKVTIIVIQ